jgi:hypothetical protein
MKNAKAEEEQKRFWTNVNKEGAYKPNMPTRCWEWGKADDGYYGEFRSSIDGKSTIRYAHVLAWRYSGGPKSTRQFNLHHLCNNKLCVNPAHSAMLSSEGHGAMRTVDFIMHCKEGHIMNKQNTHVSPNDGRLICKICDRERKQKLRNAKKRKD